MVAIKIENLKKEYKDTVAVNSINLEIEKGEFFGLLGVNGAGKTTTINMLSCLLKPTDGNAFLEGHSIIKDCEAVKEITNVSPQETAVAPKLTVFENLIFMAEIYGIKKDEAIKKSEEMIDTFELKDVKNKKAKNLSGGMQRRLSIAMALVTNPHILFLDEPTLGLDVIARRELWESISQLKGKITIVLTTHYLEEATALADRIAIMVNGSIKSLGTADEITKKAGCDNFEDAFVKVAQMEAEK